MVEVEAMLMVPKLALARLEDAPVLLDQLAHLAQEDLLDQRETVAMLDDQDLMVDQEPLVQLVLLDVPSRENVVPLVPRVLLEEVTLDPKEHLVLMAEMVHQVHLVPQDNLDQLDLMDNQVNQVEMAYQEAMDNQAHVESQDNVENLEYQVSHHKENQELQDEMD